MEIYIKEFMAWYRKERDEFCRTHYIDKGTWLKKKLRPYVNWENEEVLVRESDFALLALSKLKGKSPSKNAISLAQLALSNRVEYLSDHSDFYATYAGLMIFTLAMVSVALPLPLKLAVSLMVLAGVLYSFSQRLSLRREVATSKELVNILKQYESRHA